MLELFREGQVYEVLLVTRSNVTPVGVVRRGNRLFFRLFGGKSAEELKEHPYASIQITNDAELLVKLGLNLPVSLEFEGADGFRWIKGLPGFYGRVDAREEPYEDELGETRILVCSMAPEGEISGNLPNRPLSRADCMLIEMAVDLTRLIVAADAGRRELSLKLGDRIEENYGLYLRFGGSSEIAERIVAWARELLERVP
ncbi:DUF447 domain-containing protein [Thermococcus radiotolerans]|uniref:DUF447 domain-containing protein n=1 Tax=Thermococcus radiotolerans TaxID=187880 RepID=A0A2Z2MYK0_9EURY|nr:DUF447 domain-containing protein [Thermococcus radiotolerans]ASJ13757.1 hypothetical protein A3L10_00905 [Thermococcus radiotolerans]